MFNRIAIRKLNDLIKRDDFVALVHVCDKYMIIKFKAEECKIDSFGRVEWKL